MACAYPLNLGIKDRYGKELKVDCGRCLSCLIKKTTFLEFLADKEKTECYKRGQGCSFITLTYADIFQNYSVPKNKNLTNYEEIKNNKNYIQVRLKDYENNLTALEYIANTGVNTLKRRDLTLYIKRIRQEMARNNDKREIKLLYCGEYGSQTHRAHYHLIIFGLTKEESAMYSKGAWKYGLQDIGALGAGGIRYLIDYINKSQDYKERNELYKKYGVEKPFIYHSINFGKKWIDENATELIKNDFYYYKNGKKKLIPTKIIKYICSQKGINEKAFYSKLNRQYERETEQIRQGRTLEQYKFDLTQDNEERMYKEIRQRGEKSISPEYIENIKSAKRPETIRIWAKDTVKNASYKRALKSLAISDKAEEKKLLEKEIF